VQCFLIVLDQIATYELTEWDDQYPLMFTKMSKLISESSNVFKTGFSANYQSVLHLGSLSDEWIY